MAQQVAQVWGTIGLALAVAFMSTAGRSAEGQGSSAACPGFGVFPMLGIESITIGGQASRLNLVGGQLQLPNTCWAGKEQSLSLGGELMGSYGVLRPHVPGVSVKEGSGGPESCYRTKSGNGACFALLGELILVKNGLDYIIGTLSPQISLEKRLSTSFVARFSGTYANYKLLGAGTKTVSDIMLMFGVGYCK